MKEIKVLTLTILSIFSFVASAELTPLNNQELSSVNANDGIGLRLEIGYNTNSDDFVPMTNEFDPKNEWEDTHMRARSLGTCDDSTGVNRDCTRRLAIEFAKSGSISSGEQDSPFAVLLDGFEAAINFEQINLDLEEITRNINGVNQEVGALKVSFPARVDISRLTADKISLVPTTNSTSAIEFESNPTSLEGDLADKSLFGYTNNQINLFGFDADTSLKFGGSLYLFPVGLDEISLDFIR